MSFQRFISNSYCVGGRHRSATTIFYGDITSKISTVIVGFCSICIRKHSMTVSDNTILAEGLVDFFENLGKKGLNISKKMAKNIWKKPGRALEIGATVGTAFASRSLKAALTTLTELINLYLTSKGLYLGKFVKFLLYQRNKKHQDYTHLHR